MSTVEALEYIPPPLISASLFLMLELLISILPSFTKIAPPLEVVFESNNNFQM